MKKSGVDYGDADEQFASHYHLGGGAQLDGHVEVGSVWEKLEKQEECF